jgi:hypothetical protein
VSIATKAHDFQLGGVAKRCTMKLWIDVGLAIILGPYDFHSFCYSLVIVM